MTIHEAIGPILKKEKSRLLVCIQINMILKEQASGHDEFERVYILLPHPNEVYKILRLSSRPYVQKLEFRRNSGFHLGFNHFFFPHIKVCRILAPQPGIEPMSSAAEAWSLNHLKCCWATRKVPQGLNNLPKFIDLEWSLEDYVPNGTGHTSVCVLGLPWAAECLSHFLSEIEDWILTFPNSRENFCPRRW